MPRVDFIFDYGSPNAYLAHRVIPEIEARTGVSFNYLPCLLGGIFKLTANQSPLTAFAQVKGKLAYEQLEMQRFVAQHGISEFRMNPYFPINTLDLMRMAAGLELEGGAGLERFSDDIFHVMWEDPRNMNDPDIVSATLKELGYNATLMLNRCQFPEVKARLIVNTEKAVARGVFGVPSFLVGDQLFFGKDRLPQVEQAILRSQ